MPKTKHRPPLKLTTSKVENYRAVIELKRRRLAEIDTERGELRSKMLTKQLQLFAEVTGITLGSIMKHYKRDEQAVVTSITLDESYGEDDARLTQEAFAVRLHGKRLKKDGMIGTAENWLYRSEWLLTEGKYEGALS